MTQIFSGILFPVVVVSFSRMDVWALRYLAGYAFSNCIATYNE